MIKAGSIAGLGLVAGSIAGCSSQQTRPGKAGMIGFASKPKDLIKVGFVGIGHQGTGHVKNLTNIPGCQVTALCDIRPERVDVVSKIVTDAGFPKPKAYTKGDMDFKRMCENEDLDLVYNAAPWRWHTPICLAAMKNGKHAASEVNIALSIDDCWELVETSEKTQKHCIMQENCCYDYTEMMVLNMIRKGLFGEVMHGECGYLHDLRGYKLSPTFYQGMWRIQHSVTRDGNLYPTHGIGPMAWCMDINRGDSFDFLIAMSGKAIGLNEFAKEKYPDSEWVDKKFNLGDVNITLIRTKKGKTIICKHDTDLPRPYSRDFLVQGSKGLMRKYPSQKIHIEGMSKGHSWEDIEAYTEKYEHPVWTQMRERSKGAGHGGMDYIEDYRLIKALEKGLEPDIDVYDSVAWSAIIPLSEKSIAGGSVPVKFPDFTRGGWTKARPLQVDLV
jgi:hypothetical protein